MAESAGSDATERPRDGDGPTPIREGGGSGTSLHHGLRGPMDVIVSAAQALWRARLPAAHHGLPGAIRRSAGDLLSVINDLLDTAAAAAGDIELIRNEFNLRDCVADTLAAVSARARRKGFALAGHVAADVPNILFGDPGRLRQVASCLLDNAVRFTERGRIALDVRTESQSRGEAVLHFRVSDTGVGIAPQTQGRVFAPFHAGGCSDRGGVCLAVAAEVVKRMGGR